MKLLRLVGAAVENEPRRPVVKREPMIKRERPTDGVAIKQKPLVASNVRPELANPQPPIVKIEPETRTEKIKTEPITRPQARPIASIIKTEPVVEVERTESHPDDVQDYVEAKDVQMGDEDLEEEEENANSYISRLEEADETDDEANPLHEEE